MNIALISLYDLENSAVRLLAASLRQRGHRALEVYFKDWKNNSMLWPSATELRTLRRVLSEFGAQLVGFSLRASAYLQVCEHLAGVVKEGLGVPVLVGGIHATLCPETVTGFADFVIRGEAEEAVAELMDRMDAGRALAAVPNVWRKTADGWEKNDLWALQDLDRLPYPDYLHPDKAIIDGSHVSSKDPLLVDPIYLISASRGCPYCCSFCYNSTLREVYRGKGKYWRVRSVDHVLGELRLAKERFSHLRRVRFDDEVFPRDKQWLEEFFRRYPAEVGLPFECFFEPRAVKDEQVRRMADAGLDVIYMGIQGSERVNLELYHRRSSQKEILRIVRLYHSLGVETRVQVMVDDPLSTEADRRQLFDLLNELPRPYRLYLFSTTVMPGTELARQLLADEVITPAEVEGEATKTFSQYRVSLDWDRPPDEMFWVSLLVLVNKPWMPRPLLRCMSRSALLRDHARGLSRLASLSNMVYMASLVPSSVIRGEIGIRVVRRFWNPGKWITA